MPCGICPGGFTKAPWQISIGFMDRRAGKSQFAVLAKSIGLGSQPRPPAPCRQQSRHKLMLVLARYICHCSLVPTNGNLFFPNCIRGTRWRLRSSEKLSRLDRPASSAENRHLIEGSGRMGSPAPGRQLTSPGKTNLPFWRVPRGVR